MQEFYSNPAMIMIPVSLAFLVILAVWLVGKNKRPQVQGKAIVEAVQGSTAPDTLVEEVLLKSETGLVNALVEDVKARSTGKRWVKMQPGKDYGRQWQYDGALFFWLVREINGVLYPVLPQEDFNHSTAELYEALQTRDDMYEVLGPQSHDSDKIRLGLLVAACIVALFLMYLAMKG